MKIRVYDPAFPSDHEWAVNGIHGTFVNGVERDVADEDILDDVDLTGTNITVGGGSSPVGSFAPQAPPAASTEDGDD